ncbi:MAG: DNA methyltransferase, partial [Oscillospiraceae bacterium]
HETLLWCCKSKSSKYTFNYKTMKFLNGDKQDKSVWNISICIGGERIKGDNGKKAHNTQKPERLLYKIILSSTKPDDLVLDPFFGTGTTGAVAKRLGRHFIGIEKEAEYIAIAQTRIHNTAIAPSDIELLSLEVKPPKVPMKDLIAAGYISVGEALYDKNGQAICTVSDNGNVSDEQDTLSIHKMSAKVLGKTNYNGWNYFYVKNNNILTPIDELRYRYVREGL